MFKGILIEKDDAGYRAAIQDIDEAQLPDGDVTVRVTRRPQETVVDPETGQVVPAASAGAGSSN